MLIIPYKLHPLSDQGGIFPGNPGQILQEKNINFKLSVNEV